MLNSAQPRLQLLNRFLSLIVLVLGVYILISPFLPIFVWQVDHHTPIKLMPSVNLPPPSNDKANQRPAGNTLIVPKLNLKQQIYEGLDANTLDTGLWRLPASGDPAKGGNTVIAGHRFIYGSATPFYHLDKMSQGDNITIYWQKVRYDYTVIDVKIVQPTEVSVLDQTKEPQLTLFTCTPLWTAKERLIVIAKLTDTIK